MSETQIKTAQVLNKQPQNHFDGVLPWPYTFYPTTSTQVILISYTYIGYNHIHINSSLPNVPPKFNTNYSSSIPT